MSRGMVSLVLICSALLVWFYLAGPALQSHEIAFALGLIIGILVGWWSGGWLVLRKQWKDARAKADSNFKEGKERYL